MKRLKLLEKNNADATNSSNSGDEAATEKMKKAQEKRRRQVEKLETKLRLTKAYDIDRLVELCSKRIGLANLAPPRVEAKGESSDNKDDITSSGDEKSGDEQQASEHETKQTVERSADDEEILSQLTEDMLKHKRLVDAVEKLNERITDNRRWVLRREDHLFGNAFPGQDDGIPRGKKRKGKMDAKAKSNARVDHAGPAALFIGSLSGGMGNDYGEEGMDADEGGYGDYYGPGGHEEDYGLPVKKKNRPGQRQRKAKAMAIEAKEAGKTWDSSSNWREKKKKTDESDGGDRRRRSDSQQAPGAEHNVSASGLRHGDKVGASDVATMGKDWKDEGKAHPSWVAQQAAKAKSGIQQFAGKKITFD